MLSLRTSIFRRSGSLPLNQRRHSVERNGFWLDQGKCVQRHPGRLLHSDSFLQGSAVYLDEMYAAWRRNPASVDSSLREYFDTMECSRLSGSSVRSQASQDPARVTRPSLTSPGPSTASQPSSGSGLSGPGDYQARIERLVRAYQVFGHQKAKINPLDLHWADASYPEELRPEFYGFNKSDMDRTVVLGPEVLPYYVSGNENTMALRDLIKTCEAVYCSSIGSEYHHVVAREEREWIRGRIETHEPYRFSTDQKRRILNQLVRATAFEKFMAAKFPNAKRFSIEGAESQVPAVTAVIDTSAENGVREIIFPCCHRGKLNVLSNVAGKPNELIFSEFSPEAISRHGISGDVKYHLGMNSVHQTPSGKKVSISTLPNPSHLESQGPVGHGMARAIQEQNGGDQSSIMVFNSHTDASLSGQGIIYETLGLSGLKSYGTGGAVHLVVNNQIGFTTNPESARSSPYVTDIAKTNGAPIFHVNADDVEAVVFVCELAAEYRAKFGKDCWVDMVCFRKHGHNEMDQPFLTQPLMYQQIERKKPHLELYANKLVEQGVVARAEVEQMEMDAWNGMAESLAKSNSPGADEREYLTAPWRHMKKPREVAQEVLPAQPTAITPEVADFVASKLGVPGEPFQVHKTLKRSLHKRQKSLIDGHDIDWATAESLAMGSLCLEGYHVRVSGQDVERGTFSQRHAVVHDQRTGQTYTPLDNLSPDQARFTIGNSPLSEYGVMGFDYGYSTMSPGALVMWEAQFGDFANNAQCIIDQFISSAENKWLLRSGLVLSLPHGYDGQGPEHSSGRMERFLQLCSEDGRAFPSAAQLEKQHQSANMQVVCMTTPANLFHVLRRQLHREFRKPLVIFFSKSLLRHPMARSNREEFTGDSKFQPLIPDSAYGAADPSRIKRVIYCTGQVYVALSNYREAHGIKDTAISRVEQLHPFPWELVRGDLHQYPNVTDVVWCQEESLNDGPWSFVQTRFETIFDTTEKHKGRRLRFAGREASPSVATGFSKEHRAQEGTVLKEAFAQHY